MSPEHRAALIMGLKRDLADIRAEWEAAESVKDYVRCRDLDEEENAIRWILREAEGRA